MKRIDDLVGATVRRIEVGRYGTMHLYFKPTDGTFCPRDWNPMIVQIPKEPKKRKVKR